jgi:formate dehydrogenase iron-sulfur subunit
MKGIKTPKVSKPMIVLWLLAATGLTAIVYRFIFGIGSVSNLSDGYPWGLWVAVDIMAGVALASGGFVILGTVHLCGGNRFQSLVRPAVLTALLGYLMFVIGLIVDMGRPWHMFYIMIGNRHSPLYEIGWCASLYTFVLFMELLPAFFEKFQSTRAMNVWHTVAPFMIICMLTLFTWAMTYSVAWTLFVAALLIMWEAAMWKGILKKNNEVPILLIAAGVMLSFLHQSSLGTLYLLAGQKLNPLWHSPMLPVLFLLSAIAAGICMVAMEAILTHRILRRPADVETIFAFVNKMPFILCFYLLLKASDILSRNMGQHAFEANIPVFFWWAEIIFGVMVPLALFLIPKIIRTKSGIFAASFLVVSGVVLNRINVAITGINIPRWEAYYPSGAEVLITLGIISSGILAFTWISGNFPIHTTAKV